MDHIIVKLSKDAQNTIEHFAHALAGNVGDHEYLGTSAGYASLSSLLHIIEHELTEPPSRLRPAWHISANGTDVLMFDALGWRLIAHMEGPDTVVVDYIDRITDYHKQDLSSSAVSLIEGLHHTP
jgi:hypothetical protein